MVSLNSIIPAEVSSVVSVQITMGLLLHRVVLRRVQSFPTHSQPDGSVESPHYPLKLASTIYYARSYPYRLMVAQLSQVVVP
jgi:hypothetical protein